MYDREVVHTHADVAGLMLSWSTDPWAALAVLRALDHSELQKFALTAVAIGGSLAQLEVLDGEPGKPGPVLRYYARLIAAANKPEPGQS